MQEMEDFSKSKTKTSKAKTSKAKTSKTKTPKYFLRESFVIVLFATVFPQREIA